MTQRVCEILRIEKPIIQGPMFWLTNAEFVAAISNAGGLGVLGINAGQYEPTKDINESINNMRTEIIKTRKLTQKPIGINLIFSDNPDEDPYTQLMIDLMIEQEVPVAVIYSTSYIQKWIDILKKNNITTIFRPGNPTKKIVQDSIRGGVDIIAATGFDEGGTLPESAIGTFSIIPLVVDVVAGKIPVLAAGGIIDERTTRAAFSLGVDGIFVGTAFLASNESPMAENIKQKLIELNAHDLLMFRAPPAFYRSLPGKLPDHLVSLDKQGVPTSEIWKKAHVYNGMRTGMLLGDLENGYASFGLGITSIKKIEPIKTIVDRLYQGVPKN